MLQDRCTVDCDLSNVRSTLVDMLDVLYCACALPNTPPASNQGGDGGDMSGVMGFGRMGMFAEMEVLIK